MGDATYQNTNFIFRSKGVSARSVDDTLPEGMYLNELNCEELAENSISNRLGTILINRSGNAIQPLSGPVHSLAKLSSLNNFAYRYAGSGQNLYRRPAAGQGPYIQIASNFSGQPWQAQAYGSTEFTSNPYIFFADAAGMFKDNGTLPAPQQTGIFQPQYPVQAQAQAPAVVPLDPVSGNIYSTTGVTGFASNIPIYPITGLANDITTTGIQETDVTDSPNPMTPYQYVNVGAERVLVLQVTTTGFIANFQSTHTAGTTVSGMGYTGSVASTGNINCNFTGTPIAAFPGTLQAADYIGLQLFVSDPTDIQQIVVKFDCGDGSFSGDYFYKVIAQGPLQNLLNEANQPATAATDIIVSEALGVYGNAEGNVAQLGVGQNVRTPLLIQLSDFAGAGRADFSDPTYNWQNVNGYQVTVVTNNNQSESVLVQVTSVILFGGAGPDVFAGVAYDYLFTFFNAVDGTESNPCMVMSNVNPPLNTNWVYPRRAAVQLQLNLATNGGDGAPLQDGQITHVRIYRRGGTLGDNYRRIDQVPCNITAGGILAYLDTASDVDIQQNDFISFEHDVPVTSTLPTPVNVTLNAALNPPAGGAVVTITPSNIANISPRQQVSLGTVGALANNFETVIVLTVGGSNFQAFVQNAHAAGEPVTATAKYGQPVPIMCEAFGSFWYAGDPNNPHYLYWSPRSNPQYVSSAAYVPIGTPDDPITVIVQFKGNLFVSTQKFWWAVAPGSNSGSQPTVYPTAAKHGCVARMGFVATEDAIFYQAMDGIRAFAGGGSSYLTQDQEFIWQGVGSSPIVAASQASFSSVRMAYWNMMLFVSYLGVNNTRHRMIYHMVYKRWRNDDVNANSMLLEADTNSLVFGDTTGGVHVDRQNQPWDEVNNAGQLQLAPIAVNLQTGYTDMGEPSITKSFQELTLDINTNGETLNVALLFEDGAATAPIGTVMTKQRQKVNFILNNGNGYEFYKVAPKLSGTVNNFIYIYQCSIKHLPLAKTRRSYDSFWLNLGTAESKVVKQVYFEYTISPTDNTAIGLIFNVFYDGSSTSGYNFTLPNNGSLRQSIRVRLPAVSCRMIRFVAACDVDFQIWESSRIEFKPLCFGKGYQQIEFVPNG